jgi:DNA polymerase III sliding clamp (beta) subunit (PCNA family)
MKAATFNREELEAALSVLEIGASKIVVNPNRRFARLDIIKHPRTDETMAAFVVGEEIVAQAITDVECDELFSTHFPVDMVKALVGSKPDDEIVISEPAKSKMVHITAGKFEAKFARPNEPMIPFLQNFKPDAVFKATEINDLLVRVQSSIFTEAAVSKNYATAIAEGAFFVAHNGTLYVAATDGNRMARAEIPYDGEFEFVIKKDAVVAISKLFRVDSSDASIKIGPRVTFRVGLSSLEIPTLNVVRPAAFDVVWAMEQRYEASFDIREAYAALGRVRRLSDDASTIVTITPKMMSFESTSQKGSAKETLVVESNGTATFKIFSDYFYDALKGGAGTGRLKFTDSVTAVSLFHDDKFQTRHVVALMRM